MEASALPARPAERSPHFFLAFGLCSSRQKTGNAGPARLAEKLSDKPRGRVTWGLGSALEGCTWTVPSVPSLEADSTGRVSQRLVFC